MPCVSTNLNEIKNFNKKNNNIVDICKNDEEFLNSIDRNLNMQPMLKKKLVEKKELIFPKNMIGKYYLNDLKKFVLLI